MAPTEVDDILGRVRRLNSLVTAYGHVLIASELDRPLPAVIPLLESEDVNHFEAASMVRDILHRGGAALLGDLEELERLIRQAKKDSQITAALRGLRLNLSHTARLNAGALARKMERSVQSGIAAGSPVPSLLKELQAFINGVAYAVRDDDLESEEVFGEEDPTAGRPAPELPVPPEPSLVPEAPVPSLYKEGRETAEEDQWLRDRVDVYNEMLARWGAGEAFVPASSPLVRRGTLTVGRCAELHQELLAEGTRALVLRIDEVEASSGADRLRYLRTRIADGLAAGVPRILALLASGEPFPADLLSRTEGTPQALDDLTAYLTRAVALFDDASPQHSRLAFLTAELRSAIS